MHSHSAERLPMRLICNWVFVEPKSCWRTGIQLIWEFVTSKQMRLLANEIDYFYSAPLLMFTYSIGEHHAAGVYDFRPLWISSYTLAIFRGGGCAFLSQWNLDTSNHSGGLKTQRQNYSVWLVKGNHLWYVILLFSSNFHSPYNREHGI